MTTDAGLSVRDLRDGLQRRLERSGLLDRLRAQLRAHLVAEIRTACAGAAPRTCAAPSGTARALNVVVAEFLARHEHDYARSVFLSESGTDPDAFAADELERLLSLPPKTIVDTDDHSILEHIVQRIVLYDDANQRCSAIRARNNDEQEIRPEDVLGADGRARRRHDRAAPARAERQVSDRNASRRASR